MEDCSCGRTVLFVSFISEWITGSRICQYGHACLDFKWDYSVHKSWKNTLYSIHCRSERGTLWPEEFISTVKHFFSHWNLWRAPASLTHPYSNPTSDIHPNFPIPTTPTKHFIHSPLPANPHNFAENPPTICMILMYWCVFIVLWRHYISGRDRYLSGLVTCLHNNLQCWRHVWVTQWVLLAWRMIVCFMSY